MKLFKAYRPFLIFLAKFFGTYAVLTVAYTLYLRPYEFRGKPDPVTMAVANQSRVAIGWLGANSQVIPEFEKPWVRLTYNNKYVARIIEGCNAVSVMILFASVVVAFAGKWLATVIFIFVGSAVIHFLNIIRIALLCAALFHWPSQEHLLHGVVFPLTIYGVVFLLWVLWVNRYSNHARSR